MSNGLVYLAGPITGLSYEGCTDWREHAKKVLAEKDIVGLSPLRAKDYLASENIVQDEYTGRDDLHPLAGILSCSKGITTRDRWDTTRCDVVLANFLGADRVSIGTCMEIAWADAARVPTVVVIEPKDNPNDHAMIRECTGFRAGTLADGLAVVKAILSV